MQDLLTAVGLAICLEGALYALFPEAMKKMMEKMINQPEAQTRVAGLFAVCVGVALVWIIRN